MGAHRYSKSMWQVHGKTILDYCFPKFIFFHLFNGRIRKGTEAANYWKEKLEYNRLNAIVILEKLEGKTDFETVQNIMKYVYKTYPPRLYYKHDKSETWNRPSKTLIEFEFSTYKRKKESIGTDCDDYAILLYSLCRVAGVPVDKLYLCFMKTKTEWHLNLMFIDNNVPYAIEGTYYPEIAIKEFGKIPYMQLKDRKGYYYSHIKYLFNENESRRYKFWKK